MSQANRKFLYWKLIASFVLLSFSIVVILTFVFRSIYMDAAYKEVTGAYRNGLNRIAGEIAKLNEEVDYIYISVISNPTVEYFLNQRSWDAYEEYKVRKEFARFRNIHSKVLSMYIYNGQMNYFVSTDAGGMDYPNFPDRDIIGVRHQPKYIVSREIKSGAGDPLKLISYVYNKYGPDGKTIEHSIVINVRDFEALNMLGSTEKLNVIVADRSGEVVSTGAQGEVLGLIRNQKQWNGLLASLDSSANRKLTYNGTEYIAGRVRLDSFPWDLIMVQNHDDVTTFVREKTNQILYIGIGVLLLSVIVIAIMAKNIYSPIDVFIKRVNRSGFARRNTGQRNNELDYLMDGFVDVLEQLRTLTAHHESTMRELKGSFLKQLLTGPMDERYLQTKMAELNFDIGIENIRTIVIRIDDYSKLKCGHRHLYETTIFRIASDILQSKLPMEPVNLQEGIIAIIVNEDGQRDPVELKQWLTEIGGTVRKALGKSVTIGIGSLAATLEDIEASCKHAISLTNHRLTVGYGKIVDDEFVNRQLVVHPPYPSEIEKLLIDSIKLNKESGIADALDRLEETLRDSSFTGAQLILMQLGVHCIRTIDGILGEREGLADFYAYYREIEEFEILAHWKNWFHSLFIRYQSVLEEINLQKNNGKAAKIAEEAICYIAKNYSDANLTIDTIAGKFGYSPNYFAKLFKDATGEFINDHIRKVKIERAKLLLEETELAANEIAELTGYMNRNYFYYAFKKVTGMTPLSYRLLKSAK